MESGGHTVSSIPKLRFRGTFIDVASAETPQQTPRAQSEPKHPVHDRFYFEEECKYVAQLSHKKWCVSEAAKEPRAGAGQGVLSPGSSKDSSCFPGRSTEPRPQPLIPRRHSAGGLSSASDSFGRGQTPQRCREGGSEESAPALDASQLPLLDLLGKPERVDEASTCPSWCSNVGSGSGKANEADLQSPQDEDEKCDSSANEWQRGCSSDFRGSGEATSAIPGEWEASNPRSTWLQLGGDAASEPAGSSREQRHQRAPWLYQEHPRASEVAGRYMLPHEAGKRAALAALSGQWQVDADGVMEVGTWTIQSDGKAFFNGERFGEDYDIFQKGTDEGNLVFQRGDGWTAQMDSLGSDLLVWTKPGEIADVTWKRKTCPPGVRTPIRNRESVMELRSKMEASAQQLVSGGWRSTGRLSRALAVIEEIPMRISEDMQRAASYVVDSMQTEVAAVSKEIRGGDWGTSTSMDMREMEFKTHTTEKVIKNLEAVPTTVSILLEDRVKKAKDMVTHRVRGMIQNLSVIQEEHWEDHEQSIVSQMRLVSEEVEKIAGDAVKAAAQECHAHASRQLDSALHTLRYQRASGRWEVKHDPEFWPKTAAESNNAKHNLEYWATLLQDRDYIPQSITNQVVANELLRARIRSGGMGRGPASVVSRPQSSRGGATPVVVCSNPGSQGHPNFCRRPCVHYSLNRCQNGEKCLYCHMLHPKRMARLDKQHRDELKKMSFGQLASTMFPVLKLKAMDLDLNAEVCELLEKLWPALEEQIAATPGIPVRESVLDNHMVSSQVGVNHRGFEGPLMTAAGPTSLASATPSSASVSGSERSSRQRGGFSGTFHAMGFRSLLSMLVSKAPPDLAELRDLIDSILQKARETRESASACSDVTRSASEARSNLGSLVGVIPEFAEARLVQPPVRPARLKRGRSRQRPLAGNAAGMPASAGQPSGSQSAAARCGQPLECRQPLEEVPAGMDAQML